MAQTMTPAQQAKSDAADAAEAKKAPPFSYNDELHAILEGAIGLLRHLVAVTPGAVQAHEQAVTALWDRLANLKAGGKTSVK